MRENLESILDHIGLSEGGLVDHPKDPGGRTNRGITARTYRAWRAVTGRPQQAVDLITRVEAREILREQYWRPVRGDDLPGGIDLLVMDFSVNSGPSKAVKVLQKLLGVGADGIVGAQTLAALKSADEELLIRRYTEARWAYMQSLDNFPYFKGGWKPRVEKVQQDALLMIRNAEANLGLPFAARPVALEQHPLNSRPDDEPTAVGKADPSRVSLGGTKETVAALATAAPVVTGLSTLEGPLLWAAAFAVVVGVGVAAWLLVRNARRGA